MNAYNWEQVTLNCSSNHVVCQFQGIPSAFRESRRPGVSHGYCELLLILSFLCPFVDISTISHGRNELSFIFWKCSQCLTKSCSTLWWHSPHSQLLDTPCPSYTPYFSFFLNFSLFKKIKLQHPKWCPFCVD